MNRSNRIIRLKKLKAPNCKRCSLYKSSTHICILGRGNVMAKIMLIGEAPGSAEEKTGRPFCGKAGKFLDRLFNSLDMQNLVYITNAVRCRPPENRSPTPKELIACKPFLIAEIDIIKPKVILLLGRVAVSALGFGADVNAGSDCFFCSSWPNCYVKATWHPAYALRRGKGATNDLVKALKLVKRLSNEKNK